MKGEHSKQTCMFLCISHDCENGISPEDHYRQNLVHVITPDGEACMTREKLVGMDLDQLEKLEALAEPHCARKLREVVEEVRRGRDRSAGEGSSGKSTPWWREV